MQEKEMPILSHKPSGTTSSVAIKSAKLPPIAVLFLESWGTFQKTWVKLLILTLIVFGLYGGLILIGIAGAIPLIIGFVTQVGSHTAMSPVFVSVLVILTAIFITLCLVGFLVVTSLGQIGCAMIAVADEPLSLSQILKRSLKLILPFAIPLVWANYLVLGGFVLVILPGVLFTIFFYFILFIMIRGEAQGMDALRRSAALVLTHFWGILLRIGILILMNIVISYVLPYVLQNVSDSFNIVFSLLLPILQITLGWFTLAYTATVYKHAVAVSIPDKKVSLRWFFIIATIGWLLLAVLLFFLMTVLSQSVSSGSLQKFIEQYYKTKPQTPLGLQGDLSHYRMESLDARYPELQEM